MSRDFSFKVKINLSLHYCDCHHICFLIYSPGRLCQSLCHPSAGEFCQNGGTCVLDSSKNEAKCVCTTLYKGDRCEIVRGNGMLYCIHVD